MQETGSRVEMRLVAGALQFKQIETFGFVPKLPCLCLCLNVEGARANACGVHRVRYEVNGSI